MDAIEAPDGFELETWVEMVGHRESFPYYHYYAQRQGAEGVLEVYEAGGCGWRPRLESTGPWPRVAEAYEQLVTADVRKSGFAEIVDPARRPRGFTKGMFGSPQMSASARAFCHLAEASVEEAQRRYGDSKPEQKAEEEEDCRDPRIDVRKLLNREIYAKTLRCCLAGRYQTPSGRRINLPSVEESADKTWVYVRSRPIGADVPREETVVEVVEQDCVAAGKALLDVGLRPAVLNLANRQHPGGTWRTVNIPAGASSAGHGRRKRGFSGGRPWRCRFIHLTAGMQTLRDCRCANSSIRWTVMRAPSIHAMWFSSADARRRAHLSWKRLSCWTW